MQATFSTRAASSEPRIRGPVKTGLFQEPAGFAVEGNQKRGPRRFLERPRGHESEPAMPISKYDDTWATARLPNVDVDILHRRRWSGGTEQLRVTVRVLPPAETFGSLLEISNPLLVWMRMMMEAAWPPWMHAACGSSFVPPAKPGHPRPTLPRRQAQPVTKKSGSFWICPHHLF